MRQESAGGHTLKTIAGDAARSRRHPWRPVTIVGGCGFIGSNLAESFLSDGEEVALIDNLSRPGVEQNLAWLKERHGARVHMYPLDVRDRGSIEPILGEASAIFHLAAQAAVTTSLSDPLADFATNAAGTLNVLEAARRSGRPVPVIFASTNKVYGGLEDVEMVDLDDRHIPLDTELRAHGIDERRPLDFRTPYGCSKGVADQYVLDYARSYNLPTAVLRMSCIYGPRQFGTEDQGWVAHFLLRALAGEPITIYGDGRQVRDILHVRDAVAAYRAVLDNIERVRGRAFNLGGGPHNAVSLKLLLIEIGRTFGREPQVIHGDWRTGDQLFFVSDTRRLEAAVGWGASIAWRDGLRDLARWLGRHRIPAWAEAARRVTA